MQIINDNVINLNMGILLTFNLIVGFKLIISIKNRKRIIITPFTKTSL